MEVAARESIWDLRIPLSAATALALFAFLLGYGIGGLEAHSGSFAAEHPDETRLAIESRAALSPDALIGLEANLRFPGPETMETKIFGRLTAWQNWIFNRPNAVGEKGALKVYGTGQKAGFDQTRV